MLGPSLLSGRRPRAGGGRGRGMRVKWRWAVQGASWLVSPKLALGIAGAIVTALISLAAALWAFVGRMPTYVAIPLALAAAIALTQVIAWGARWVRARRLGGIFPDVEFQVGGTGFATRERQFGELRVPYRVCRFVNVRITNHEAERRVSLSFHCRKPMLTSDGETLEMALSPLTKMPFDIKPKTSKKMDIEFEDMLEHPVFTEAGALELDVEDHLSGKRTALPRMGTWRPKRNGEWTGEFPPPKDGEKP